ncbi:Coenzyme F420 hydrogenase/dehydrogenase, beta subunit C-terminal domain [Eubacterium limosum]|uniref:Coenzyme F420 hydrogenase/dehydrogenase, beta subunit C-terminal domain n=1 Tax=Eubacterium limosum TaxID=1736 RepID=UPI0010636A6D|nr:Coenzyme F420 hydrogenase/dehydrogenase, beta subunit C-terminal domain [Eubacterium limosum]
MIQLDKKETCTGCHACVAKCPKQCITMINDTEGFWYPQINKEECINCGFCEKVCPIITPIKFEDPFSPMAYACYNRDEKVRLASSSGGVFTLIAEAVLKQGGVVFGAGFDEDFNVCHQCVEGTENLDKLRMSKYVQSKIGVTYREAEDFLKENRLVLFTGTPCQISGLKAYLGKSYDNLITQDIICHGVPSPMVWEAYLAFRKKSDGGCAARRIAFRRKDFGWKRYSVSISYGNDTEYRQDLTQDSFMKGFLNDLYLRPSCHACAFKNAKRHSDITLADFWGIENVMPEMFDDKGTSLVLIQSKKGKALFKSIEKKMICQSVDLDEALKYNPAAIRSALIPKNREVFYNHFGKDPFDKIIHDLTKPSFKTRAKTAAIKALDRLGIKEQIKKILKK